MKARQIACIASVLFIGAGAAQAQVSVDVAKITCRQLLFDKVISPNEKSLALWLSGYYNAKRNSTVIDIAARRRIPIKWKITAG
ncbi:MAG: HdeA/HdeB family chaperone [Xanthobacteraceae bacterium]